MVIGLCLVVAAFVPPFWSKITMGSEISGSKINLYSSTTDRFISSYRDDPVEMTYDLKVSEFTSGIPSEGSVSAYTKGNIMEGRSNLTGLYQTVEFSDFTSMIGSITKFEKKMTYSSSLLPTFIG
jgi:hypothetical protein